MARSLCIPSTGKVARLFIVICDRLRKAIDQSLELVHVSFRNPLANLGLATAIVRELAPGVLLVREAANASKPSHPAPTLVDGW